MKEARYVIRLAHSGTYTPADVAAVLPQIKDRVRSLSATATNLRISETALEFDLFCAPESELHCYFTALESIGPLLTYKQLDAQPPSLIPGQVIAEARALFNDQRFWEVHEVLEGLWKKTAGDEKRLLQGLILTAAALVHAQKNELNVVLPMFEEAALRLENQPETYYGLDVRRFSLALEKAMRAKNPRFPTI